MATKDGDKEHRQHWNYATTGEVPGVGSIGKKSGGSVKKAEGGQVIKPTVYKRGGRKR